jgi:glyoxylase-like metal-dependent hydrolase (beta-lactamase superfamily II)
MHIFPLLGLSAAASALASITVAQGSGPRPPQGASSGAHTGPLKVHQLTPAIHWVEGGVGNCGFIIGKEGVIVIDTTVSKESGMELLAIIGKITPKPVTTILLTHSDMDHIGGLAAFPSGLTIIAQENNRKSMEAVIAAGRGMVSAENLPNRTVSKEREAVEIEGVKLELFHWAPAHTAGDLVVYLPDEKIVFCGDIFTMDQFRALIHRQQNGSSEGWITTAKGVVALNADRFVVGHGEVQTRENLQKRVSETEAEWEKIKELVTEGMSLAQVQAAVGDPPPGQGKPGAGGPRFTPFSEVVYQELTETNP